MKGIDVSKHNGKIDWLKVKAAGIGFAMIRAGYGKSTVDERAAYNLFECRRLGIPFGVYWFSYALTANDAKKEAKTCLEAIKGYEPEYPIAFDYEYDSIRYANKCGYTASKTTVSSMIKAFCEEIKGNGYYPINYTNLDFLDRYTNLSVRNKYDIWLAAWSRSEPPIKCGIWQYSEKGKVDGISGDVDLNEAFVDFPTIIKEAGLNGFKKQTATSWSADAIKWGVDNGITDGTDMSGTATREQIITMLKRYHEKFSKG